MAGQTLAGCKNLSRIVSDTPGHTIFLTDGNMPQSF
jgi:hypothetical protein